MDDSLWIILVKSFLAVALVFVVVTFVFFFFFKAGYKAGQISAIRGEIEYELVEEWNGETHWKRIRKN